MYYMNNELTPAEKLPRGENDPYAWRQAKSFGVWTDKARYVRVEGRKKNRYKWMWKAYCHTDVIPCDNKDGSNMCMGHHISLVEFLHTYCDNQLPPIEFTIGNENGEKENKNGSL